VADLRRSLEETLGHSYVIERELGGGGMSRVFLAGETALQRKVVIKVLPGELSAEINAERFRREIQLAAKLQHPYIVPVLATGMANGQPYFTMPFVEGESLRARLQKTGELAVPEAIGILRDVLEALAYAHECGVVHRDIKPENILLARNHAHVADFGVAKALSASTNAQSGLTSLGVALGTPAYMAPEQAMADPSTDHRADLYAVGAMGYEMLTGYQVFSARSPQAMLAAHATEAPEPILKRRPNVAPALADLITRLLEKRPADRPQSANEALTMLAGATTPSGGMAPTAQHAVTPNEPFQRRNYKRAAVLAAAVLVVAAGVAFTARFRASGSAGAADAGAVPSIAVMPFENMSGDPKNDYLGDGLSEELIGGLSRLRGLQVAARTSSFAFKGKNEDVKSLGAKLGVSSVLGGSVRRSGNKLRVSVQLTSAATGYNLWSETYDRDMSDVFAVEDDISKAIVNALAVRLASGQTANQLVQQTTSDPEAYDLYLKGRYEWQQRGQHLKVAESLFRQALARDSSFALAWAGLADVYTTMSSWGYLSPRIAAEQAPLFAERATSLAPSLPETHLALGTARCNTRWEYVEGLAEIRRAIKLNPSLGVAHYFASLCLGVAGRPREALQEAKEAQRLEPLNAQFSIATGRAFLGLRQPDSAIATYRSAMKLSPGLASPYTQILWAYALKGDTASVKWTVDQIGKKSSALLLGSQIFGAMYTRDKITLAALHPEKMKDDTSDPYIAAAYAFARNSDSTLAWLDRVFAARSDPIANVQLPMFDWVRSDPRYIALAKKYNLPNPQR
jgi:TolB-like protein/tRNA A-37 threonylcarbamoyl transferase component Bud32